MVYLKRPAASDVEVFEAVLQGKLSGPLHRLPLRALEDFNEATALSNSIWKQLKYEGRDMGEVEADVLRYILDYELQKNKGRNWTLSRGGLAKAVKDFVMFNDFNFGPHRQFLQRFVAKRWHFFVTDKESEELEAKFQSQPDGQAQLLQHM